MAGNVDCGILTRSIIYLFYADCFLFSTDFWEQERRDPCLCVESFFEGLHPAEKSKEQAGFFFPLLGIETKKMRQILLSFVPNGMYQYENRREKE